MEKTDGEEGLEREVARLRTINDVLRRELEELRQENGRLNRDLKARVAHVRMLTEWCLDNGATVGELI